MNIKNITHNNVVDAVRKLVALFDEHNGSNGSAHLPASTDQPGFMSVADKTKLDALQLSAKQVEDGTDVLDLSPGQYLGRNLANRPSATDDSMCLYVIDGNDYYRFVTCHWLSKGYTYVRKIYGTTDSGWFNNGFVSLDTMNGWTGTLKVRRFWGGDHINIELNLDIKGKLPVNGVIQIGMLPNNCTPESAVGIGCYATDSNTPKPAGITIASGKIYLANQADTNITSAQAQLTWNRIS